MKGYSIDYDEPYHKGLLYRINIPNLMLCMSIIVFDIFFF